MKNLLSRAFAVGALLTVAVLAACDDPFQVITETEFAASLGVDLVMMEQLPGGTYIMDRVLGTGPELVFGSTMTVTYTGWLADGTEFDSGSFTQDYLEQGGVIAGFREGILGMNEGGTRLLVIPPDQAYGDRQVGIIPPGAILVFEVTLDAVIPPA